MKEKIIEKLKQVIKERNKFLSTFVDLSEQDIYFEEKFRLKVNILFASFLQELEKDIIYETQNLHPSHPNIRLEHPYNILPR